MSKTVVALVDCNNFYASCERVFQPHLEGKAITYTARAAEKMRYQRLAAREISVFIQTNRFREWEPQYSNSMTLKLPVPTDCTDELIQYAQFGLEKTIQGRLSVPQSRCHVVESDTGV